jgi:glutamate-5-semialdehyde dehydrogenase
MKKNFNIKNSIKKIIKLKDPTNIILEKWKRPNGLNISKVSIPIGVIGVIYESRPNVTSDVASIMF